MNSDLAERPGDLTAFVRSISLRRIAAYEMRVRDRRGGYDDMPEPPDSEVESEYHFRMYFALRQDDERLAVRIRATGVSGRGDVAVEFVAFYTKREPVTLDADLEGSFINRVAIVHLYPYVRQAVADLTGRIGPTMTLDQVPVGTVELLNEEYDPNA